MNITCDIIRDLLPLYAEDMVSEDSKQLVDEHLCTSDPCTKQRAIMKKVSAVPVEVDTGALKRVGNIIRRRRILTVITAILCLVTLLMSAAFLLDARIYLNAKQAVRSVEAMEDESIRIHWNEDMVVGVCGLGTGSTITENYSGNYGVITYTRLQKLLTQKSGRVTEAQVTNDELNVVINALPNPEELGSTSTFQLEGGATNQNLWYCSAVDGTGETLLWDAGNPAPEVPLNDVNYHLAYYCGILFLVAVVLALPGIKFNNKWYGEHSMRFSILLASVCLSSVIVSAAQFMELYGEFTENVVDGFCLAVPMALTVLFARQLHKLTKQDKGE